MRDVVRNTYLALLALIRPRQLEDAQQTEATEDRYGPSDVA